MNTQETINTVKAAAAANRGTVVFEKQNGDGSYTLHVKPVSGSGTMCILLRDNKVASKGWL